MSYVKRSQLLDWLVSQIIQLELPHPIRIAIDGPDAAGKTTLAEELIAPLRARGRHVIRASIDGFHNPAGIRHRQGRASPEGYYYDSFNYSALIESLLEPLGPGGSRQYQPAVFDCRSDSEVQSALQVAEECAVLVFDGIFLLRPELLAYWDFTIFVEVAFDVTIKRAEQRDAAMFESVEELRKRYKQRYIPGQQLYFDKCRPRERATIVIDNNDPNSPAILSRERSIR